MSGAVGDGAVGDGAVGDGAVGDGAVGDGGALSGPGAATPDDEGKPFEALLAELETVTDRLAGGEVGIEEATDLYERAEHLHLLATRRLAQVQARVDRLREGAHRDG